MQCNLPRHVCSEGSFATFNGTFSPVAVYRIGAHLTYYHPSDSPLKGVSCPSLSRGLTAKAGPFPSSGNLIREGKLRKGCATSHKYGVQGASLKGEAWKVFPSLSLRASLQCVKVLKCSLACFAQCIFSVFSPGMPLLHWWVIHTGTVQLS